MLTRRMSAKAAAVAATLGALLAGGTAAAATGSLPVPAQSAVSSALAHVGVSVPKPNPHANRHATNKPHRGAKPHDETTDGDRVADRSEATGPDATGSAKHGLCRAWAATPTPNDHSGKRDSVAFTNLQAAADAAGMSVADFCKDVTPTTPSDETAEAKPSKPSTAGRQPRASKPEKDRPSTGDAQSDNPGAGESADGTSHAPDALPAR